MKVWWVLAWDKYYPKCELGDVLSTHLTEEEAEQFIVDFKARLGEDYYDYMEVTNVSSLLGIVEEQAEDEE